MVMGGCGRIAEMVFWRRWSSSEGHGGKEKNNVRWGLGRIRFCRDDFRSDSTNISTSLRSCETNFAQSVARDPETTATLSSSDVSLNEEIKQKIIGKENNQQTSTAGENSPEHESVEKEKFLFFQPAFRIFMEKQGSEKLDGPQKMESLSGASLGISTKIRPVDSVQNIKIKKEINTIHQRKQHKVKTQGKPKEEWDANTMNSNTTRQRLQNRMEAINRRERALAYAYAQQRKTRMAKREPVRQNMDLQYMGWSWTERWMDIVLPENYTMEDDFHHSNLVESISCVPCQGSFRQDSEAAMEEMESCGSNDVPVNFEVFDAVTDTVNYHYTTVKNKFKAPRQASRSKS